MTSDTDYMLPIDEARERLAELVDRVARGKERLMPGDEGKPIAALVPVEDAEALEKIEDAIDVAEARKVLAEWEANPGSAISLEELAARCGVDLNEPEK